MVLDVAVKVGTLCEIENIKSVQLKLDLQLSSDQKCLFYELLV